MRLALPPRAGRPRSWRLIGILGALSLTALAGGCAKQSETEATAQTDQAAPVDISLLAFLSRARSAHHRADLFEEKHDIPQAIRELDRVIHGPQPAGGQQHPELREVFGDTLARLADLKGQEHDFEAALADVERGLTQVPEVTYFRGHLFEVRGITYERQARQLEQQADAKQASATEKAEVPSLRSAAALAKDRALSAFEQSMAIQAQVIDQSLPAGSK